MTTPDTSGLRDPSQLADCIEALLVLDAKGALAPHGVGGLARSLLAGALPLLRTASVNSYSLAFGEHEIFGDKASIDVAIRLFGDQRP